ncbi:MAG: ROK family protein [Bacteroidota bacterium]
MDRSLALGVDVGATGMKANLVDCRNGLLMGDRFRIPTPDPATPIAMAKVFKKLVENFKWEGPVGVGFPAIMNNGVAESASNIDKSWIGTNVEKLFEAECIGSVKVINDADAAGVAEMAFGQGMEEPDVVLLLTIGTGIGSALFIDGKLVPNTELGHLNYEGASYEKYVANSVRKELDLTWTEWGKRFNQYLQHIEFLFSPQLIILGGGSSKASRFNQYKDLLKTKARIVPARFENNAGIIGSAMAAYRARNAKVG